MRRRGERGETLAEVLVSTTLLGIIGIGIVGAIAAVLISTDIDRRVSAGETVLRSYVAAIEQADYSACNGGTDPDYSPGTVGYTVPPRFNAQVTTVKYLVAPAPDARPVLPATPVALDFRGGCPSSDPGVQLIDVKVTSTGSRPTSEHISFVKRQVTVPST
jgi:type II secretory pathway pseudopilin PulG